MTKQKTAPPLGPPTQPPLDAVLKDLAEKNSRLEALDLRISESISSVEILLRKCLSVHVSLLISEHSADEGQYTERLAFRKGRGSWSLAIEVYRDGEPREWTPLNSCSREVRARMFADGHIEALIREASRCITDDITVRSTAIDVIDRLVSISPQLPDMPSARKETSDDDIPF